MTTLLAPIVGFLLGQSATTQEAASAPAPAPALAPAPAPVPEILEKAFMQRMAFQTARFTLRIEKQRRLLQPYVQRFRYEWAHSTCHVVDLGDDHGLRQNGEGDEVLLGMEHRAEPRSYFMNALNDEYWSFSWGRVDHHLPGFAKSHYEWFPDPRSYGLLCGDMMPVSPGKFLDSFRDARGQFVVKDSGPGCVHVRHIGPEGRSGHSETEWWIDVAKGPSVTQVRHTYVRSPEDADVFADLTSTVELIDGHWWPRRIEGPQAMFGKDRTCIVTFEDIEFDRPEHPQAMDADVLKIPFGTRVWRPTRGERPEHIRYAGRGRVIAEDYWLRMSSDEEIKKVHEAEVRDYSLNVGFAPDWWDEKGDAFGLKDAPQRPELWELYLRRWALKRRKNAMWIVKNPLTDEQCRAALAILDDCREKTLSETPGDVNVVFEEFKKRLGELLTDAQRDPGNAGWHQQRLEYIKGRRPTSTPPRRPPLFAPWNKWPGGPAIF